MKIIKFLDCNLEKKIVQFYKIGSDIVKAYLIHLRLMIMFFFFLIFPRLNITFYNKVTTLNSQFHEEAHF